MDDRYTHGILKMKKPATKIMSPPGGQSHLNIFAQEEPEELHEVNACQASRNKSSIFDDGDEDELEQQKKSAQLPAQLTPTKTPPKPSTKVLAPPGGASSFSFGGDPTPAAPTPPTTRPAGCKSTPNEAIGQKAINRRPPGGESHNIFG